MTLILGIMGSLLLLIANVSIDDDVNWVSVILKQILIEICNNFKID